MKTALYVVYPDKVRHERAFPFGTIANTSGGFSKNSSRTTPSSLPSGVSCR